jgi:hypothetical protein
MVVGVKQPVSKPCSRSTCHTVFALIGTLAASAILDPFGTSAALGGRSRVCWAAAPWRAADIRPYARSPISNSLVLEEVRWVGREIAIPETWKHGMWRRGQLGFMKVPHVSSLLIIAVGWTRMRREVDGNGSGAVVERERVDVEVLKNTAFCCLGKVAILRGWLLLKARVWEVCVTRNRRSGAKHSRPAYQDVVWMTNPSVCARRV